MMGDREGGGGPEPMENSDSAATTSSGESRAPGPPAPPFRSAGSSMDQPQPAHSPINFPPTMSPFWHGPLTPSFMSPGMSPAWPGGMDFASVGSAQNHSKSEEFVSTGSKETEGPRLDGQSRNRLHTPTSDEKNERGNDADGNLDRGNFSTMRTIGSVDDDDHVINLKKKQCSQKEERDQTQVKSDRDSPCTPPVYPSQPIFPQNEARKIYPGDSTGSSQDTESSSGMSKYTTYGATGTMPHNMFNVPFSSKAFISHMIDFAQNQASLLSPPPAHTHVHDAAKPGQDFPDESKSPLPDVSRPESKIAESRDGGADQSQPEITKKEPSNEETMMEEAEAQPPVQSRSPSPVNSAPVQSSSAPFVVTPNVYSDSDTDEYAETDYKPVIANLAAEPVKETSPTETNRRALKLKIVVKQEPESDNSSGSDYTPYPKAVVKKEKSAERVQPSRRKRQSVRSSFTEYYEDSDDSLPEQTRPRQPSASVRKMTPDTRVKKSKTKKSRPKGSCKSVESRTCPECHKVFTRAESLTVHMRVHTGERPFHCDQCDATYKVSSHLRNHIRSKHSNTKEFKCDICSKAFSTSNARRRHEKTCGTDLTERVKHQCSRCHKCFVTAEGFERHQKLDACTIGELSIDAVDKDHNAENVGETVTKQEGKAFPCQKCPKAFAEYSGLETHEKFLCGKGPGTGPYSCCQCQKVFVRWNLFVGHCRRHTGDKPYLCSQCDLRFHDKDSLRKHVARHQGKTAIKCSLCEKQFTVKRTLAMHIMRVHCGMKPYKCNECDNDFASAKLLSTHIRRVHRKEKRFKCQLCGRGFFESQAWMKHMVLHAGNRPPRIRGPVHKYPCNLCGKQLNMRLMRMHVEEDHPGVSLSEAVTKKKSMVSCTVCNKEFSDPSSLKMHMIRHSGKKDFKCTKCDMSFVTSAALDMHQFKHSDDRPFTCEECGQAFRWKASLRDHVNHFHNPDLEPPDANGRRFECKDCGSRFKRYNTLRTHTKKHRGLLSICSECGKGFTDNTRLRIHMSVHSGADRPFICETCGAGFFYGFLLKRHINSRHNPSPWLCNLCGRSLCSKDALKRHLGHHARSPDGKVHVGGNRGRPRKYVDPNAPPKEPKPPKPPKPPKDPSVPKVKGKRGRKPKKTIEIIKQVEDEICYQNAMREEPRNVMDSKGADGCFKDSNSSMEPKSMMESTSTMEPTSMMEPRSMMDSGTSSSTAMSNRTMTESRAIMESGSSVDSQNMTESRNLTEARNMMESRHMMESRNVMEASHMMEPRNMTAARNMTEARNVMEARNMVEARNMMQARNQMESRNMMDSRNLVDSRGLLESRGLVEARSGMEARSVMGSRDSLESRDVPLELRNSFESRDPLEHRNSMEPRTSAESRETVTPELRNSMHAGNGLERGPDRKQQQQGGVYAELTRASEMQINSHIYAQQNFGYTPANYIMNPLLWPKTEDH